MEKTKPTGELNVMPENVVAKQPPVTPEERYRMIEEAAYFRSEKRGFVGGNVAEDWIHAEAEIDHMLKKQGCLPSMTPQDIQERVQESMVSDTAAIAAQVRAITLDALTRGNLDTEALRQVSAAVVKGAREGAAPLGDHGEHALKEAMRGLDDALAAAAEAAQLAIQEAAGRSGEFTKQGLKQAVDDLSTLQMLFVETLQDAARNAQGIVKVTLADLAEHARTSGSAVGHRSKIALDQLTQVLKSTARSQAQKGTEVLRHESALLAGLAAGLLQGVAARLMTKHTDKDS